MDYEKLSTSILAAIENRPGDIGAYEDLFSLCQAWAETDFAAAHRANKKLKDMWRDSTAFGGGGYCLRLHMTLTVI